jgi:chitinase
MNPTRRGPRTWPALAGATCALAAAVMVPWQPAGAASAKYEAENATVSQGAVESNHAGFTGSGFVNYDNLVGSYVQWTVTSPAAGTGSVAIRYANGTTVNRSMDIRVNGSVVSAGRAFNGTGNWDTWAIATLTVPLVAGSNTVRATATTADGGPNVDYLTVTTPAAGGPPGIQVAPYEYFGWGSPQSPTSVMSATGVKWFTLAFMLSNGGCTPAWDGDRPLTGGDDQSKINAIRGAGGDVMISFGGFSGAKLGEHCTSASALAGAYQRVIDAYALKAIDIDIEASEFSNGTVRKRVVDALKIVKTNNPGIKVYVTLGVTPTGPDSTGRDLINKGAAIALDVDGWTVMPFDFGGHSGTMGQASVAAAEGTKAAVKSAYGYTDTVAYSRIGISSMNGKTDESDETVSTGDFQTILGYAQQHHIARLTFWSINRDRQCAGGLDADSCSGVSQSAYAYTKILVQYSG